MPSIESQKKSQRSALNRQADNISVLFGCHGDFIKALFGGLLSFRNHSTVVENKPKQAAGVCVGVCVCVCVRACICSMRRHHIKLKNNRIANAHTHKMQACDHKGSGQKSPWSWGVIRLSCNDYTKKLNELKVEIESKSKRCVTSSSSCADTNQTTLWLLFCFI